MVRAGSRSVTRAGPPTRSRAPRTTRAEHKDRSPAASVGSLGTAAAAPARRTASPPGRPGAGDEHVGCVAALGMPSSTSPATAPSGRARRSPDTPHTGVLAGGCSCPAVADLRRRSEFLVDPPRRGSTSPRSAHGGQVAPVDPVAAIRWIRSSPPLKDQRSNQRQQVWCAGYSLGMSRQRAPVRRIQRMPSTIGLRSCGGRPRPSSRRGGVTIGASNDHCAFVSLMPTVKQAFGRCPPPRKLRSRSVRGSRDRF